MKAVALTAFLLVVLLGGGKTGSQELSTHVYPSEDEIYNALLTGEISYQQYLVLQDIITNGLDSTNQHYLDEIPNLSFFNIDSAALATTLEADQQRAFDDKGQSRTVVSGFISQDFASYADEGGRTRSVSRGRVDVNREVSVDIKIRRDYNTREYCAGRSATVLGKNRVREVIFGNFSRRLALGTVFGHRGKLLKVSDELNSDSFLFPEYGGQNGVSTTLALGGYKVQALGSVVRNEDTRLSSLGGMIQAEKFPFRPALICGFNKLKNRVSGESLNDTKLGVTGRYDYDQGYAALETCWQMGESNTIGAIVGEGRHRFRQAEIRYAGWRYGDDYVDLTGGSKAAAMYHQQVFEKVDREYTSKRSGQQGILVKTVVDLTERIELANSLLYASFNSDTTSTQWLAQMSRKFGGLSVGLDFLTRGRTRGDNSIVRRQVRFVARLRKDRLYLRAFAGYNTSTAERDFISFFVNLKYRLDSYSQIELWSNIAEIDHSQGRINHWYAYIRSSLDITEAATIAMKLSHTYSYGSSDEHRTVVGLDVSHCF